MLVLSKRTRAVCSAIAAYLLGVTAQCCAAQDATATYPVKGVVLNSVTHQPVARALVSDNTNGDAVLTDNDGHFELELPAGQALLRLKRPGYGGQERASSYGLKVGGDTRDLTLYLTPNAILAGRVTLSSGDEADGIRITAYRRSVMNGREGWSVQNVAVTNSDGVFRLGGLPAPGSYILCTTPVHERVGPIAPGATGYGYSSLYYPGVTDVAGAGVIALSEGQQVQADFTLTRQPFYPVSIAVPGRQRGGRGGGGIQIHDMSGRTLEASTRWDPENGIAQINLPTGRYYAEMRSGGETQTYGRVEFAVAGGPVAGLTMSVVPLHAVLVNVKEDYTAADATGISSGGSSGIENNAGLSLTLASTEAFEAQRGIGSARPADGSNGGSAFQLENVIPGRYWVTTYAFQGYVSSITSGGVDLAREPLTIGAGNATSPIEVTLRNDGGKISGQLNQSVSGGSRSGSSVSAPSYIYAIPLFSSTARVLHTEMDAMTQFSFSNVAPGSYHVIALDKAVEIDPTDAQTMAKYAGKGQTVTVEASGTANVQLDVLQASGDEAAQ